MNLTLHRLPHQPANTKPRQLTLLLPASREPTVLSFENEFTTLSMDPSNSEPDDTKQGSRTAANNDNSSERMRGALEQLLQQQQSRNGTTNAAASPSNQVDVSALLRSLMLPNNNSNNARLPPAQPQGGSASATLLMQQLTQSDPSAAIAALASSGAVDLRTANLQAQAMLKEQEDSLRSTRLMLRQQCEQFTNETIADATNQESAASQEDKKPAAQEADSSDDEDARKPAAREDPEEDASKDGEAATGEAQRGPEPMYDDDDLDDDAYFKGFDKEDSHQVNNETFPFRLYRMLYEVEKSGKQDVASFSNDGQMFCVRKPKRFVDVSHFMCSTVKDQTQLNLGGNLPLFFPWLLT